LVLISDEIACPSIIPPDEPQRLAAVRRYDILDTPPDGTFDRITALAARRFLVPISIVSIVDYDRIWFKSHHGLDVQQIGRDPGLCASAILSNEPWLLPDARKDPRSLANPLVVGEFGLRFYLGIPLQTWDGFNLGTLCVIDKESRTVDQQQIEDLKDLASLVMDQMELRLSARRAVSQTRMMTREIDHRVMNSLQFVSAMLTLQARSAEHPSVARQLDIAAGRVGAVARVHRHFHVDEATDRTDCLTYLRRLCADLSGILQAEIAVEGTGSEIPTGQLQSIGLIANELITNSAKHGAKRIEVTFTTLATGDYELRILDDGKGLPAGFDPASASGGLGMKLVSTLAAQLGGSISARRNPAGQGACFILQFPKMEA
jgi:two-component sensor histidine kinase